MRILSIDPGPTESGWAIVETTPFRVVDSGVAANADLRTWVKAGQGCSVLAIEMIASFGMPVGKTTFETVRWIGRFQEAWHDPEAVQLVLRMQVKMLLCKRATAKDANVWQALVDLIGEPGTKKAPGPLYGVRSHARSALAVAVTCSERFGIKVDPQQRELVPA